MSEPFSYDAVTYPSMVFPHIRPDQIGAISILHGVTPDKIEDCRVLELGCGDGANLLSIAYTMPDSFCVGVDLSAARIDEANEYAKTINVRNVEFHHLDMMEYVPEKLGKFDFIIAHGVYSWVPQPVREKLLWIYQQSLKPNGIGFISYNTYPGWHIREIARDAMRFQTEFINSPLEKVGNGLRFVEFLTEASKPDTLYQSLLTKQQGYLIEKLPESVFHDDLAKVNQPFYFHQFVENVEKAGLKFLSELEPMSFFIDDLPSFARQALDNVWDDPTRREQYLDFIRGRFFRSSLVCRNSAQPSYRPLPESLDLLYFSSCSRAISRDASLTDNSEVAFSAPKDSQFETDHPLIKSLLGLLSSRWPERISFSSIRDLLKVESDFERTVDQEAKLGLLQNALVRLINANIVEPRCFCPQISLKASEHPKVSDFARWQAGRDFSFRESLGGVTNMHGQEVKIENSLLREMIILSDGTRDRSELEASAREWIEVKPQEQDAFKSTLTNAIDANLDSLARSALLIS